MSAISLKSISGITSITTPAGVDDQLTLHNNNTTEAVKLDIAGNLHFHNHLNITGISTAANFKTGTSNLHSTGLNVQDLDVDGHTNLDNVSIVGIASITNVDALRLNSATGTYQTFQYNGIARGYTGTANHLYTGGSNGDFGFAGGASANIVFATANNERLRIDTDGKSIIKKDAGSTNNAYSIATEFNAKTSGSAAANFGPALYLTSTFGNTTYAGTVIASQSNADVHTSDLVFYPRNYSLFEGLRLASNGRVGIRTDTPQRELDVYKGTGNDCTIVARTRTAGAWFEANSEESTGYYGLKLRHGNTEKWFLGSYGSNNLQLKTATANASSLMEITPSGNIGIGTNIMDSSADLSITNDTSARIYLKSGNASDASIYFGRHNDAATAAIRYDHSDESLRFYGYNNNEYARILGGALLVNRTAKYASSSEKLSVNGMTSIQLSSTSNAPLYVFNTESTADGTVQPFFYLHDGNGIRGGLGLQYSTSNFVLNANNDFQFRTGSSGVGGTEKVRITSTGLVKITTAGNIADGTYYSTLTINNTGSSTWSRLRFDRSGVARWGLALGTDDKFRISNLYTNGSVGSPNDNCFVISNSGNIGINESDPDTKLEVDGIIKGSSYFQAGASGTASNNFHFGAEGNGEFRIYSGNYGAGNQKFKIDSSGNAIFGDVSAPYSSNSVTIHPDSGMVNFGMDGRSSLVTSENSCYIFSGSGASGDMPAGSLVLQSRANVNRNIFFATGATPSLKWQINGSNGRLEEFPYNTSTSTFNTSTGNGYQLSRVRNGQVPQGTSGNTYTLINTNTIADAGAYILVLRSFEQSQTGGVLWSVRVVSSVFYLHYGTGNDGETVTIPVTYAGHANNANVVPVTLKHHFYNGSAHTHGKITITFNGYNYTGTNCDYYLYKVIDI